MRLGYNKITQKYFGYIKKYIESVDSCKNNSTVHLITCIGIDFDCDYISHFIEYYKKFKISTFNFILQTRFDNQKKIWESRDQIHALLPKANVIIWEGEFYPEAKAEKINSIINNNSGDWHLVVDIDEFVDFQDNSIQKILVSSKSTTFFGQLIDRVAEDGKPKKLETDKDIFTQFPKSVEYTKKIGGVIYKPILFRNQLLDKQLHKTNKYSYKQIYLWRLPVLRIYHFKWISSSKEKLLHRQSEYKKRGYSWYIESERAIDRYF